MEGCTELLESNQEIRDLLREAHRIGHYAEIRRRAEFHTHAVDQGNQDTDRIITPPEPVVGIDVIDLRIKQELQSLRLGIEAFLKNPEPHTWNPPDCPTRNEREFLQNLHLPCDRDGRPSLLLHDLGACDGDEIEKLFQPDQHMVICNSPGSGKTRRILESLTKFWGFYFVAVPDANGVGVHDLRDALLGVARDYEWVSDLRPLSLEKRVIQSQLNSSIASHLFKKVLAARLMVFELFLELAIKIDGELLEKRKRTWLLFQSQDDINPQVGTTHPFGRVIENCLRNASTDALDVLLTRFDPICAKYLPPKRFIIALDEAHQAIRLYPHSFTSCVDAEVLRSTLRELVAVFTKLPGKLVVSGTGLPLEDLLDYLAPGVSKAIGMISFFHDLGMFDTWPKLKQFLERYFPTSFLESPSGQLLQRRIREYLLGRRVDSFIFNYRICLTCSRYRFCASFLENLLINGLKSPHKLLNEYIKQHTTCFPGDTGGLPFTLTEPELAFELRVPGFEWDRLLDDQDALQDAALIVQSHLTKGEPLTFGPVTPRLVEYGIAFLYERSEGRIVEPLAFLSLLKWLENEPHLNLSENVRSRLAAQPSRGQELVILYLLRALRYPVPFSAIFTFHGTPPWWADELGCLDGTSVAVGLLGEALRKPGLCVVHYAPGIEDVLDWLENPTTTQAMLVPGTTFGLDVLIRCGDVLLMGQLESCTEDNSSLTSLHADGWFKESPPDLRLKLIHAIERHRVLRFVGGYPLPPNFGSFVCDTLAALGTDVVVATVNVDTFRAQFITADQVAVLGAMEHAQAIADEMDDEN